MLRNQIEKMTGLTRKAVEYYEQKGLIQPKKTENGYREYSEEDLAKLKEIALYRKLGLSITDIKLLIQSNRQSAQDIIREQEFKMEIQVKKQTLLKELISGADIEDINSKLCTLERAESIYTRLTNAFPDYFGQIFFCAYKPFLNDSLSANGEIAYEKYIKFLDDLPSIDFSPEEIQVLETNTQSIDMSAFEQITEDKIKAVENIEQWLDDNADTIIKYQEFKNSAEYQNSPLKSIQDKIKKYMQEHKYYEIAIPLIRQFSPSYDEYYSKMLVANEKYLQIQDL